jgi:hypothetical protein
MFCRSFFVLLYFFFWPFCMLYVLRYTDSVYPYSICKLVLYMWESLSYSHAKTLAWPHHLSSAAVWVHATILTQPHLIEVAVPSQTRVNDHVCACFAYWFISISAYFWWILKLPWWRCIDMVFFYMSKVNFSSSCTLFINLENLSSGV